MTTKGGRTSYNEFVHDCWLKAYVKHNYYSGATEWWEDKSVHLQNNFIRHVSCYALLRRCRLPWPHTCCLYEVMSSDGFNDLSDTRNKVTLLVHPTVPALLTSNGPLPAHNKRALSFLSQSHLQAIRESRAFCKEEGSFGVKPSQKVHHYLWWRGENGKKINAAKDKKD